MQLNKLDAAKTALINESVKINIQNKSQVIVQEKSILQVRSVSSLLASLGLPKDKLSANILSLTRFFSLPFKPEQLAAIRKQIMTAPEHQAKETALTKSVLSLAAVAAESKGAELQPKALEAFAEAVDPDQKRKKDDNKQERRRKQNQPENKDKEKINAVNIKKIALESAENNLVLQIMNKIPCKNEQRWIVLPFEFTQDGKDYRVSLRVLLENDNAKFMVINIQTVGADYILPYTFSLEFTNNKIQKIIYYNQSDNQRNKSESIKKELAVLFDIDINKVFVKTSEEGGFNLPEADYGEELLQFIDEAV